MKKTARAISLLCAILVVLTTCLVGQAAAADSYVDASNASNGYFTVYSSDASVKMKVGVTFNGSTTYYDYRAGTAANYPCVFGSGEYTVTLYKNVSGTSYRSAASAHAWVSLASEATAYLCSSYDSSFAAYDTVSQTAADVSGWLGNNSEKVVAIYNYISANFTYNYAFANQINAGQANGYYPATSAVLSAGTGVCYDLASVFAAMCRSQGIPCAITKGYLNGTYHAWNKVFLAGSWYAVDMTCAVCRHTSAQYLVDCLTPLTGYTQASDNLVTCALSR